MFLPSPVKSGGMANARKLLLAAAALLAGAPAFAESPTVSSADFAKSEAIIGAPSALAAILAEQGAPRRVTVPVQPASYGIGDISYEIRDAVIRTGELAPSSRDLLSPAVHSGKPDIFGTVALEVGRTPLDRKWRRVENSRVSGSAAIYAASLRGRDETAAVEAINRYVNRHVSFVDDSRRFGRGDVWASANATLSSGRGDCEDYAIAKLQMLRAAGFSDRDIYLVVLRDLVRRADHAVAVVRTGEHMYVLDNGTDELLDDGAVSDYRPILTFAANGTWTHGYRISRAPVTVASAGPAPLAPLVPASAGDQRSRSASLLAFNTGFNR